VGILASIAMDDEPPGGLRAVDARNLFSINTTSVAVRRGGLLRGYAYDFIQTFASHLTREVVEAAQAAPSDTEQAPL
jgi:LysR family cys regulon transcriptional activator